MENNRREFLKLTGLLGAASLLPFEKVLASGIGQSDKLSNICTLIPTETAGPFPLDLTQNSFYFRQDVRETSTGVQLNLRMKIFGDANCLPWQNLRVNIWQCDKDGNYSGYNTQTGLTYLRGYQFTDANGEVEFITIFPGWYPGRTCHIHFQVYVSSSYAAISQLTFDVTAKNAIYTANPTIYTNGVDPVDPANDGIFSDGYQYQLATLTPNAGTGGYDAYLEVAVQGNGVSGIGHLEIQNAKQFALGQNFPNPYKDKTTIPIYLVSAADVVVDLYNLQGQKLRRIQRNDLSSGEHEIEVNLKDLDLPTENYVYQVEVTNTNGKFTDCKMMTAVK